MFDLDIYYGGGLV